MNREAWSLLKKRLFFSTEDVAEFFGINRTSAYVICHRHVKNGTFIRLRKDFYVLGERWPYLEQKDFLVITNYLQVPSYISCTTALVYHGLTTQVPQGWYESVALKRSILYSARERTFSYFKLKKEYYFGFVKTGPFFIAQKEKAFLDICHLCAYGRYAFDWSAFDPGRLDIGNLGTLMAPFPDRTRNLAKKICKI